MVNPGARGLPFPGDRASWAACSTRGWRRCQVPPTARWRSTVSRAGRGPRTPVVDVVLQCLC